MHWKKRERKFGEKNKGEQEKGAKKKLFGTGIDEASSGQKNKRGNEKGVIDKTNWRRFQVNHRFTDTEKWRTLHTI